MSRKEELTIEECKRGYWAACARYQDVKDDPYANYFQLRDAAAAVSRWRNEWIAAGTRRFSHRRGPGERINAAIAEFCDETGEELCWVSERRSKAR